MCSRAVCIHALCVQAIAEVIPLQGMHDLQRALALVLLADRYDVVTSRKLAADSVSCITLLQHSSLCCAVCPSQLAFVAIHLALH